MSRIGKHPIAVPAGVDIVIADQMIKAKGKLGELEKRLPDEVSIELKDGNVIVAPRNDDRRGRAMWGLSRTLVQNLVTGVSQGFENKLEISGVGYRAALDGKMLTLQLGFSHDIKVAIPGDITIKCESPTQISLHGRDKQRVGQLAAEIRSFRKPEPYKGKGVRHAGERILRKEGKKK